MANGSMPEIIAPYGEGCQIWVIHPPCGMAAYLVHYGLVDKFSLVAEQGHLIGRPGLVYIDLEKEGDEITTVKVGGKVLIASPCLLMNRCKRRASVWTLVVWMM